MIFDFDSFKKTMLSACEPVAYSPEEALGVFGYYFERYEEKTGKPHPWLRAEQIKRIVRAMPYICGVGNIPPFEYRFLIDRHFQTRYRNCDYNINHFFSGRVRALRMKETNR